MTVTMSLETARRKQAVACMLLHPGTTKTDLSGPFQKVRCRDEAHTHEEVLIVLL